MNRGLLEFPIGIEPGLLGFPKGERIQPRKFPTDYSRITTALSGGDATPAFLVPFGVREGDLIVLQWRASGSAGTLKDIAGFTQLLLSGADASDDNHWVGYKFADRDYADEGEVEGFSMVNAVNYSSIMWCIKNGGVPTLSSTTNGTGQSNPPSHTPAAGRADYLWLALGSNEGAVTGTSPPQGFENYVWRNVSSGTNGTTVQGASKYAHQASMDPGAFAAGSSNQHMVATMSIPFLA